MSEQKNGRSPVQMENLVVMKCNLLGALKAPEGEKVQSVNFKLLLSFDSFVLNIVSVYNNTHVA